MSKLDVLATKMQEIMTDADNRKPKPYDTTATVTRVDGDTVWVHIPGGVDETPIKKTINAKPGDVVQVRVSGGTAWISGNATAPPTDDSKAEVVAQGLKETNKIVKIIDKIAGSASKIATSINQYFWHVESGTDDNGAHITQIPKEEFLADPAHGGPNLLMNTNGIAIRKGTTELATFKSNEVTVGLSAVFGAITRLGYSSGSSIEIREKKISATGGPYGLQYWAVGDLNGSTYIGGFTGDGSRTTFELYHPADVPTVIIDGTSLVYETDFTYTDTLLTLATAPAKGKLITVTYDYGAFTPYFTFGNRGGLSNIGAQSASFGNGNVASGGGSFAEGSGTQATGDSAHSEGVWTKASGDSSHAEGWGTESSGGNSHAEGCGTESSGENSHAQNLYTIAAGKNQTAIGKYNAQDTSDKYSLIIGNGTASDPAYRKNALTVDWYGNVDASGTVLGKLKRVGALTGEAPSTEPTIATGASWKNLQTITLTKGVWMVTIGAEFAGNSTGIRAITLSTGSSGATTAGTVIRTVRTAPASTGLTCLQATFPVEVTSASQVFYLNAFQTSGSTLTVKPRHTAIKLGNFTST